MKIHSLTNEQIETLLVKAQVGRIATQSPEGYPYVVPMHFVYYNEKIYTHGLPKGQKLEYITQNPKVGFEVDEMIGLLYEGVDVACHTNTEFNSVIILGNAKVLTDLEYKKEVLNKIVDKYTPHFSGKELSENMVRGTAVIEISVQKCTGKYYK
jgi:nitroimidazol reductase NimA-like FMN-containing flavoprotein (pyridoxamine 5'-phosphate oxidase superfamily)